MKSTIIRVVVWGAVAIAVAVVFFIRSSRNNLNKCIDEANASSQAGDDALKAIADDEYRVLEGNPLSVVQNGVKLGATAAKTAPKAAAPLTPKTGTEEDFAGGSSAGGANPSETKPGAASTDNSDSKLAKIVASADEKIEKVIEDYRAAADKFEEAKKYGRGEVVTKYLDLMSQAYRERADGEENRRKAMLLMVDKSIPPGKLRELQKPFHKNYHKADKQFEKLTDQAKKFQEDNKSLFK